MRIYSQPRHNDVVVDTFFIKLTLNFPVSWPRAEYNNPPLRRSLRVFHLIFSFP